MTFKPGLFIFLRRYSSTDTKDRPRGHDTGTGRDGTGRDTSLFRRPPATVNNLTTTLPSSSLPCICYLLYLISSFSQLPAICLNKRPHQAFPWQTEQEKNMASRPQPRIYQPANICYTELRITTRLVRARAQKQPHFPLITKGGIWLFWLLLYFISSLLVGGKDGNYKEMEGQRVRVFAREDTKALAIQRLHLSYVSGNIFLWLLTCLATVFVHFI